MKLARKVKFMKQYYDLLIILASSPGKNLNTARKALKYMLPTIPERSVANKSSLNLIKKFNSSKVCNCTAALLNSDSKTKTAFNESLSMPFENPCIPRSMSNIRSQDSLTPLMQMFSGIVRTPPSEPVETNYSSVRLRQATNSNGSPTQREKRMKKLKLLVDATNEKLQLRNRSVSIEPGNTSPEKVIAPLCVTAESGKQTDGSSNEPTSEECSKHGMSKLNSTNSLPLHMIKQKRSMISPPSMEPQSVNSFAHKRMSQRQLNTRIIKNIARDASLKKAFSVVGADDRPSGSSLALPNDSNYNELVHFTENLKQVFVVPSTARTSNMGLPTTTTNIMEKCGFIPVECIRMATTPQNQSEVTKDSAGDHSNRLFTISPNYQTLNSRDLAQKFKEPNSNNQAEPKHTNFSNYIKLKPKQTIAGEHDDLASNPSQPAKIGIQYYCEDSDNDNGFEERVKKVTTMAVATTTTTTTTTTTRKAKKRLDGNETTRNMVVKFCNNEPVHKPSSQADKTKGKYVIISKGTAPAPKLKLVHKTIGKGTPESTPKMQSEPNKVSTMSDAIKEIKEFQIVEDYEAKTIDKKASKKSEDSDTTDLDVDYADLRAKLHIQKGEMMSLFAVLKVGSKEDSLRLAIPDILPVDPFGVSLK